MTDNIDVTPGTGATIAADLISGALHQRIKVTLGADGVNDGDVSSSNPMPITGALTDTQLRASAVPISAAALPLPSGAATSANQSTEIASLASIDGKIVAVNTGAVTVSSSALPSGASTAAKQPALGTAGTPSADVITVQGISSMTALKVDGSAVIQPISATTLPLPTGAATETTLASLNSKVTAVNTGAVVVSSSVLPSGASTAANQATEIASLASIDGKLNSLGQKTMANSVPVVIASDQSAVPISGTVATTAPVNLNSSGSAAGATVTTVVTLTAPSNAVGFILMNTDISTTNARWAIGRTATPTLGQQLQPGRDTGFVPCGANVSLVAESGTVTYDIQWVSQ